MRVWEYRRSREAENKERHGVRGRAREGNTEWEQQRKVRKKIEKKWDKVELL